MKPRIDFRPHTRFVSDSTAADWSRVPSRGHGVQFYYTDDQLLRLLTRYAGMALVGGDAAVVIATDAHLEALEERLAARGLDVSIARREGRLVAADARKVLDEQLIGGCVDESKAQATLEGLIGRARAGANADGDPMRVFVFGEVVALLAAQHAPEEALRLEELWNALSGVHAFTLCCGYPMAIFGQHHAASFVRLCATHSHVFHASAATHQRLT